MRGRLETVAVIMQFAITSDTRYEKRLHWIVQCSRGVSSVLGTTILRRLRSLVANRRVFQGSSASRRPSRRDARRGSRACLDTRYRGDRAGRMRLELIAK